MYTFSLILYQNCNPNEKINANIMGRIYITLLGEFKTKRINLKKH